MRHHSLRHSLRGCSALTLGAILMLASTPALADGVAPADATAAQKKQAMDHLAEGKTAAAAKDFDKAITELRASLDVVSSPNTRLELARALRDHGVPGDAWTQYGRVIDDAAKESKYQLTVEAATAERAEVEARLAFVTVTLAHAPADAMLKVGGRSVPNSQWGGPIMAAEGAVDVVLADASGKELARQTVLATTGQKTAVTLDGQPAAPPTVPAATSPDATSLGDQPDASQPQEAPSQPSGRANLRPYAYVAGGVGVAGLAVFTIFGIMSHSDLSDLQSSCPSGSCPSSKAGEISDGRTFQTLANVGLAVGIVGVAAGTTLFVLSLGGKSPDSASSTSLVVGPGYVGLHGSL